MANYNLSQRENRNNVVKQIPVTTTMTEDNKVIVAGIHAKDIVATSGQNKLQAGSVAIINNTYDFKNNP